MRELFGLLGLLGLRPGGFLGARGRPCIVFGCAAPRRYSGRDATHPVRHVRQPFPRGFSGAGRQHDACEAQEGAMEHGRESLHSGVMPRHCGDRDAQSRLRWDDTGSVNHDGLANAFVETGPGPVHAASFPAGIFVNRLRLPFEQSWKS